MEVRDSVFFLGSTYLYSDEDAELILTNCSFFQQTVSVRYSRKTNIAENNWWGDPSGPNFPGVYEEGKGSRIEGIGNEIDFHPWLKTPPKGREFNVVICVEKPTLEVIVTDKPYKIEIATKLETFKKLSFLERQALPVFIVPINATIVYYDTILGITKKYDVTKIFFRTNYLNFNGTFYTHEISVPETIETYYKTYPVVAFNLTFTIKTFDFADNMYETEPTKVLVVFSKYKDLVFLTESEAEPTKSETEQLLNQTLEETETVPSEEIDWTKTVITGVALFIVGFAIGRLTVRKR
ncbi:MAG: hypothetical protein NDF55_08955 [archaeon GB-1867-005]|nr:hypothetical protein [Candidatus Culexmicrobium cathedralense]